MATKQESMRVHKFPAVWIIIIGVIVIAVAAFAVSRALSNSNATPAAVPAPNIAPTQTTAATPITPTAPTAPPTTAPTTAHGQVVKVDAYDFLKEFSKDATAADKKYQGKTLEMSGPVGLLMDLRAWISPAPGSGRVINCNFNNKADMPSSMGSEATIRGTYRDYAYTGGLQVNLYGCYVVK